MANIRGNNRSNTLNGGAGADVIDGRGGDDVIVGGGGDDIMLGGGGRDRLVSDAGNDTMTGGSGGDTFVISATSGVRDVVITDFQNGVDKIELSGFGFQVGSTYWHGQLFAETNGDTTIQFRGDGGEIINVLLEGVHHTAIDPSDYIFS